MEYKVNDSTFSYQPENDKMFGKNEVLLNDAIDLSSKTTWRNEGFSIEAFYTTEEYHSFADETKALLFSLWRKAGLNIPEYFSPEKYHQLTTDQKLHLSAIEQTKLLSTDYFPLGITKLQQRISAICDQHLIATNPFDQQSVFHFRVIRPKSKDNNPLHRDVWLEDYRDCINLYIPIAGSDANSSLILAPGSHHWPESKIERTTTGALINGVKFNVPAVTKIEGESNFIRPNPDRNEVLVFSPYLIHGGSSNLNKDISRISIELRLWRKS